MSALSHVADGPAELLPDRLARAARTSAGVHFVDRHEKAQFFSYADLARGAGHLAERLRQQGILPGERVAIVVPSGPSFYYALFAVLQVGAIAVPMYPPVRFGKLPEYLSRTEAMLRQVGASVLLTQEALRPLLAPAILGAGVAHGTLVIDDKLPEPCTSTAANAPPYRACVDDIALLQFSSGTTQAPKAVALSHKQICANVDTIVEHIYAAVQLPPGVTQHTVVSWLPLYHDMGLIGCVLGALSDGTNLALLPPEAFVGRPALWLRTLSRFAATVSAAPNFAYSLCAERIRPADIEGIDLSHWRLALNGAESVCGQTLQAFAERFAAYGFDARALTPVYGLAEAALAVTFSAPTQMWHARAAGADQDATQNGLVCVGRPLPGYEIRIVDGEGNVLKADSPGHIQVAGPSIMSGYWHDAAATRAARDGQWLRTGDLGLLDGAGALYIHGRAKDILIVRGQNHAPEMLERACDTVAGVRQGCSVAVARRHQQRASEEIVLFVELRADAKDAPEIIQRNIGCAIAEACALQVAEVVLLKAGTLPRTSSGKLRRAAALALYQQNKLLPPSRWPRLQAIFRALWGRYALRGHAGTQR